MNRHDFEKDLSVKGARRVTLSDSTCCRSQKTKRRQYSMRVGLDALEQARTVALFRAFCMSAGTAVRHVCILKFPCEQLANFQLHESPRLVLQDAGVRHNPIDRPAS